MPRRTAVELIFIVLIIINNNNNNSDTVYGAVIMNRHCESSPGSFDECRLSAGWPPTRIPSQSTWAVKIGRKLAATIYIDHRHCYYYSARRLILIYRPQRVEG